MSRLSDGAAVGRRDASEVGTRGETRVGGADEAEDVRNSAKTRSRGELG